MDFTVDSIPVKSVMKFIMKSANEIHSEIHNEILLILVKSVEFNEVLKAHEKHMKNEKHRCFNEKHHFSCEKGRCFSCEKHRFSKDHLEGVVTLCFCS